MWESMCLQEWEYKLALVSAYRQVVAWVSWSVVVQERWLACLWAED